MKIGIGTAQFGLNYGISNHSGKTPPDEVEKILNIAIKNGISFIDTAPGYGNSEEILGKKLAYKNNFDIVTKTPKFSNLSIANDIQLLEDTFYQSLVRLKQPNVYGLLVHHADDLLTENGSVIMERILNFKRKNLINKIGVSIYNSEQIDKILDKYSIDLVQVPINVLDQRLLRSGHLHKMKELGIEIHARSIFLQGLLLMKPEHLSSHFASIKEHLEAYHDFLSKHGVSPIQAALKFINNLSEIDVVIFGINNCKQLEEIIIGMEINKLISNRDFSRFEITNISMLNPSEWKN